MTLRSSFSASAMIGSMSHGMPPRWTQMTALVRAVSTARMVSAVMFWLSGATSAKTGTAPAVTMQEAEARKELDASLSGQSEAEELERRFADLSRSQAAEDDLAALKRKLDEGS